MLAHRLRRWPNIDTALAEWQVFAGHPVDSVGDLMRWSAHEPACGLFVCAGLLTGACHLPAACLLPLKRTCSMFTYSWNSNLRFCLGKSASPLRYQTGPVCIQTATSCGSNGGPTLQTLALTFKSHWVKLSCLVGICIIHPTVKY